MTCEELRIERNRAYVEYLNESDLTRKRLLQGIWKARCAAYDDAYKQEVQGN